MVGPACPGDMDVPYCGSVRMLAQAVNDVYLNFDKKPESITRYFKSQIVISNSVAYFIKFVTLSKCVLCN